MYVYLIDNFLRHPKYAALIKAIQIRLTDYGISGKNLRLNSYTDAKPVIDEEIKRGAKTVVIVGNDETFGHILSRSATCPTTFGFLPLGGNNTIADFLGIPVGVEACSALAKRRREKLDVGLVNNRSFISNLHIQPSPVEVVYNNRFKVYADKLMEVVVCNLRPFFWTKGFRQEGRDWQVHPQDGKLEAFLRPVGKKNWWGHYDFGEASVFPFEEMKIIADQPFVLEADGKVTKETKLVIKLAPYKIDMIVGRGRKF